MASNKASINANQSSIVQSDSGIIMQETSITLTDEKMNGILLHTYVYRRHVNSYIIYFFV